MRMDDKFDLSRDWMTDADLTTDQRKAWNMLRGELASAQARIQELTEKLRQAEQQSLEHAHATILNRIDFNREVARMLAFDERYGGISSILYFDFDRTEAAITQMGRQALNDVLRDVGELLIRNVRGSDIVGRLAPDEFGVLLMRCDNPSAWRKAEAIAAQIQMVLAKKSFEVTVSYGAYTFRDNEDLATGLKEAAQMMTSAMR